MPRKLMREAWYCLCTNTHGQKILRPASREKCVRCKAVAPWAEEEKRSW